MIKEAEALSPFKLGNHVENLESEQRVCLVPHFTQKNLRPIILQNGTKHHANFLVKIYLFSILDFGLKRKKSQKAKKPSPTL
jgi:hypothetical protein